MNTKLLTFIGLFLLCGAYVAYGATVLFPTQGGTGLSSYTTGDIIYASATNVLSKRAIGSSGDVLTVSGGVPTWVALSSGLHMDAGAYIYPKSGDYHSAPRYVATSTTATSTFTYLSIANHLKLGTDYVTDLTGTGLALSGNALTASLGTSITAGEIADGDHGAFTYASGVATLDTAYLTGNESITLSGDVSGTGATAITTTIGADKVLESMLKAVDTASDEDLLTYESTTGDFEWHTPSQLITAGTGIDWTGTTLDVTVTDTNANTICSGTTTYLDGEGNCDDISATYFDAIGDFTGTLTDTKVCTYNSGTGEIDCNTTVGAGTPAGSDTQVQFNDASSFGGDAGFTYNKTTDSIVLSGNASLEDLLLEDSDASHFLTITTTSDLTTGRTLTLVTGDASRTITLSGNPTLADWFDQDVKTTGSPTFAALTLTADLTVANGGTGASTLTGLLLGNGTSAVTAITNSSTVGQILRVTGASTYAWGALDLDDTDAITGTIGASNIEDLFLLNNGDVGTGVYDFGGATSFEIVNGASPTVDATGECAIDTTSGQLKCYDSTQVRVYDSFWYPAFSYSTTTWTGTTTIPLAPAYNAQTWSGVKCFTDTGTVNVVFDDGTNKMKLLNASTTVGTVTLASNNTFTAGEKRYVKIGTPASTPRTISCTVKIAHDAD